MELLDKGKKQLFVIDDPVGEYSVDNDRLKEWNKYNDSIKNCLNMNENTKVLLSLRIQLVNSLEYTKYPYIFNDASCSINLGDGLYVFSVQDMKNMLNHYLNTKKIVSDFCFEKNIQWWNARYFSNCFPLICRVFCEEEMVRKNPNHFFSDPFFALINIFKEIMAGNKHQFCGLVLCAAFPGKLTEDLLSPLSSFDGVLDKQCLDLRDFVINSHQLDPQKDLTAIKSSLKSLNGVYIIHIGKIKTLK